MSKRRRRCCRPNPRWPQAAEIAGLVAQVRAAVAVDPVVLRNKVSPVTYVAQSIVANHLRDEDRHGPQFASVLAEVVEAALADASVRLMLAEQELHVCPLSPRCNGGGA